MNFKFILIASLSLGPTSMSAQTEMTVNPATADTEAWGTARTERYDVAFRLDDSSLTGTEITSLRIPFAANEGVSECEIWLSNELTLDDGKNTPDIVHLPTSPSDGFLSARFPEPVAVTGSGCYVGFSFTVVALNDETRNPVTVSPAPTPGDMYVHTSRRYLKWGTQNLSLVPSIEITLAGNFHRNAVAVTALPEVGTLTDSPATATAILRNQGLSKVASIDFSIVTDGMTDTRHIDYEPPLPTDYFSDVALPIELNSGLEPGSYPISLTISKVNGEDNLSDSDSKNSTLYIYPYLPERTPLMEEYTGTWCGWCPRGIVGMEKMSELYPKNFVYAAYHRDKDPMNTVDELATPYAGAPSGYLDRVLAVDPYNGTSEILAPTVQEGIGRDWNDRCRVVTTGEISAEAAWEDETREIVTVKTKSLFVRDYASPGFRIGYLLIADGLKGDGTDWIQSNYYSGDNQYADTELVEFVEKPSYISDMSFDGVVAMSSPLSGVEGSLPDAFRMLEPLDHSYSFDLTNAINYLGQPLPVDKNRLHVISYITDTLTGEIVNCTQCEIADPTGMECLPHENVSIYIGDGCLTISGIDGCTLASLWSLSGTLLSRSEGYGDLSLPVPPGHGIYILSIDGKTMKLVLR